jgi:uncharacterized protein YjdB
MRDTLVLAVSVLLLADGCGPTNCTSELNFTIVPTAASIAVGQSVVTSMILTSCGGREHLADTFRWHSSAPAIASVDSLTGRVTGVAVGQATIMISALLYGVSGSMPVTVH